VFRFHRLFQIAGIPIYAHGTIPPFLFFIGLAYGNNDFLVNIALGVTILAVPLLLHELGHALVAKKFGFQTERILLTPVGGLAAIKSVPEKPKLEILIAIAGPLVNVALAPILWALAYYWPCKFTTVLFWFNAAIAAFNLLPGFPLDGGRILRALLATKKSYLDATRIAVRTGQLLAGGLCLVGLMEGYFSLVLISVLMALGAQGELIVTSMRHNPAAELGEMFERAFRAQSQGFYGAHGPDGDASQGMPDESAGRPSFGDETGGAGDGSDGSGDCVVDVDADGNVQRIWRKDES